MKKDYKNINAYFVTSDLALATSLVVLGYPIKRYSKTSSNKRVCFCFEQSKNLDKTVESFWEGQLLVEPSRVFEVMKRIKTRLYSE